MEYPFIFNVFIVLSVLFRFFGDVGGFTFLVFTLVDFFHDWQQNRAEKKHCCSNCKSWEICAAVMDDCLPDYPCAYFEPEKP